MGNWVQRYADKKDDRILPRPNSLDLKNLSRHLIHDHKWDQDEIDNFYTDHCNGQAEFNDSDYWGDDLELYHDHIHRDLTQTYTPEDYMDFHRHIK